MFMMKTIQIMKKIYITNHNNDNRNDNNNKNRVKELDIPRYLTSSILYHLNWCKLVNALCKVS